MNGELGERLPMAREDLEAITRRLDEAREGLPPLNFSRKQWRAVEAVAMVYEVSPHDLLGWGRTRALSHARQVAMAAIWKHGPACGRERVGLMFKKDKQPILHGWQRVTERMEQGDPLAIEAWNLAVKLLEE